MWRLGILFACLAGACVAEVRTLTLREAVNLALKQNPDVLLARLDERKAAERVRQAHAAFIPRVVAGSGLAYSSGFPMSIEGATPSIVQANAIGSVFNRPQSLRVGAAKESVRGAAIDTAIRQDESVYQVASMYIEAEKAAKIADMERREIEALTGVLDSVKARVAEGRELPVEIKKAELSLARARYRSAAAEANVRAVNASLAALLGFGPDDQVRLATGDRALPSVPDSPEAAVEQALDGNKEIRSLESKLAAKNLDVRSERAARLPSLDLVAQYGLLAKFNNYEQFFKAFQRHNGQLGVSFQIPLWTGPGPKAAAAQAEAEAAQLGIQIRATRGRIAADARKAYDEMTQAAAAQEIARLDLEVARDEVSVLLAQMQEGRAALRQVEQARSLETDKWIALYDAAANLEKARFALLRQTGGLLAALQ
ncbi:MAG: TolC family protein [Acidobacteriota bacterium]